MLLIACHCCFFVCFLFPLSLLFLPKTISMKNEEESLEYTKHLTNMKVTEGDSVQFTCEVSKSHVDADWFFGENKLSVEDGYDIQTNDRVHSLEIDSVDLDDAGVYTVVIAFKESKADLTVRGKLYF